MKHLLLFVAGGALLATTAWAGRGHLAGLPSRLYASCRGCDTAKPGYQVPLAKRLALVPEMQFSLGRIGTFTRYNSFAIMARFGNTDTRLTVS